MRHENMVAWSPEEDRIILEMFETHGRKWGRIAAELSRRPNGGVRTSASVRNRYLRIEKGRSMRAEGRSKNRCAACGQQKLGHVCQARLNAARKATVAVPTALISAPALALAAAPGADAPIANAAGGEVIEALTSLAGEERMDVLQVADDDVPKAWAVPRKLLAWRKHEEQAAAAARSMSTEPGTQKNAQPEIDAFPKHMAVDRRESEVNKPKLRLEGAGNVMVLTKQPSGELLVSLFSSMPEQTARNLTAAAL